jgi:hypothetical protein
MSAKPLVVLCLTIFLAALSIGCSAGGEKGDISVPVNIENANHVGVVVFELTYDSRVLEAGSVDKGTLARGADARYVTTKPGTLLVVVEKAPNIDGDGTLVVAYFKVLDEAGSSTFTIDILEARDSNTGEVLVPQVSDGSFVASDMSVEPPVITFT